MGRKKKTDKEKVVKEPKVKKESKKSNIDKLLAKYEKNYGVQKASEIVISPRVSTGIFPLDILLGGGVSMDKGGHIIEYYGKESSGKTAFTLKTIASFQKLGKSCVFINAEGGYDPVWAEKLEVDNEKLLIMRPESLEQAGEMILDLMEDGVDLIAIDSIPALIPEEEINKTLSEKTRASQAKVNSPLCRKIQAKRADKNTTIIFINQIRDKMAMYGCVHGETKVITNKGTYSIKYIVDNKLKAEVWSWNHLTNKIELKPILDYKVNGKITKKEDFITIKSEGIGTKNGVISFTVTKNHKILTSSGWKEAKDLRLGEKLISKYNSKINGKLSEFMNGVFVGDSHIKIRSKNTACLKLQDRSNIGYLEWKIHKLSSIFNFKYNPKYGYYTSEYNYEFAKIKKEIGNRNPLNMLKYNFSYLSLALWIMDDGHFDTKNGHCRYILSVKRFKENREVLSEIVLEFSKRNYQVHLNLNSGTLGFDKKSTLKLANKIKKYIPDCMQYKLPEKFRGHYKNFCFNLIQNTKVCYSTVFDIKEGSNRKTRNPRKYDLVIEGSHNFLVGNKHNGVIIHNSNETTPGGRALRHLYDTRINFRTGKFIEVGSAEKKETIGMEIKIKAFKNKKGIPRKSATVIFYNDGIVENTTAIFYEGVKMGVIRQDGQKYLYEDLNIRGKDNFMEELTDEQFKKISKEVLRRYGNEQTDNRNM